MCGIIAYFGKREAKPILIDGLKRLEYRGYDSAGICLLKNGEFYSTKVKGRVAELEKKTGNFRDCNIGIAHTRWATHGEPNEINAHPHFDCATNIAVVHNGIIENYTALKQILEREGHKFVSETDTEVLAHLIEKFYKNNIEKAVIKALKLVNGTYGIAVLCKKENKIIIAKKGSPIVLGLGKKERIIASDPVAVLARAKKVIYLSDGELAMIEANRHTIKKFNGKIIEKEVEEIKWSADQMERKGFKHFMIKEIFDQPEAIKNTLRGRISKNNKIKLTISADLKKIKKIVIAACGTSWHAGLIGKYLIEKIAKIPVEIDYASEFRYRNPLISKEDLFIVISQSGETADTLGALREAKLKGAKTLGIINVVGSTIAREVDSGIYLHAGPEIGVASTKAFSCQVVGLLMFALYLAQEKRIKVDKRMFQELLLLPKKIKEILSQVENILTISKKFKNFRNFLYLGRGVNFPVALEGALKLKEISYIHAEGYPAAEMKHGPIALIDENMPVFFIATKSAIYSKILSAMEEVKARGTKIVVVANKATDEIKKITDNIIIVPETLEIFSPIINVVALQIFAYYIADLKGIDLDKPRNLAKSVTVE